MLWYAFEGKTRDVVELEAMEQAIKAAGYFLKQSKRVYELVNEASPADRLPDYKRKIYEALPEEFSKADGIKIAEKKGMKKRTFGNFLAEHTQPAKGKPKLFEQPKNGATTPGFTNCTCTREAILHYDCITEPNDSKGYRL